MDIKLPADIEEIIADLSEDRRKIWLARFVKIAENHPRKIYLQIYLQSV